MGDRGEVEGGGGRSDFIRKSFLQKDGNRTSKSTREVIRKGVRRVLESHM